MDNWDARLLQIAQEHPNTPGKAGEILRARLRQQAASILTQDLQLAHARAREAVVSGARMSLRCGVLLMKVSADEISTLIRVAGISPEAAGHYAQLAGEFPELHQRCERRNGRISEAEALHLLRGYPNINLLSNPVADLRMLLRINDPQS